MIADKVIEARRMPNGVYIAIGDIVTVSIGYAKGECNKIFEGSVARFSSKCIVLDISERFKSSQVELQYASIMNITRVEEKPEAPPWEASL
jgi:hypothetical protein